MKCRMNIYFKHTRGNDITPRIPYAIILNDNDKLYAHVSQDKNLLDEPDYVHTFYYTFNFYYEDKLANRFEYYENPSVKKQYRLAHPFVQLTVFLKNGNMYYTHYIKPVIVYNPTRDSDEPFDTSLYDFKHNLTNAHNIAMGFFNSTEFKRSSWHDSSKREDLLVKKQQYIKDYKQHMKNINKKLARLQKK